MPLNGLENTLRPTHPLQEAAMKTNFKDFVVTGQVVLPPLMWLGTGSVEVFAVSFLVMFIIGITTLAGARPVPVEKPKDRDR